MVNLNQGILLALQVSCPSVDEQAEIVSRVETLFAFADRLEARLAQAQTAVDRLTPSLLAKAPSAAELLKRLAAKTRKARQSRAG
jgi:type I restriction enzyme, S subunit